MNLEPILKALPWVCSILRFFTRKKPKPPAQLWALIVDDDWKDAYLLELVLRRCGFEVQIEPSGEAARGNLKRNTYDLILIDMRLPGMSGAALLRVLSDEAPFAPAVVVTGEPADIPPSEPLIIVRKPVTDDAIRKSLKMVRPMK